MHSTCTPYISLTYTKTLNHNKYIRRTALLQQNKINFLPNYHIDTISKIVYILTAMLVGTYSTRKSIHANYKRKTVYIVLQARLQSGFSNALQRSAMLPWLRGRAAHS